jgi:hypothetical protein
MAVEMGAAFDREEAIAKVSGSSLLHICIFNFSSKFIALRYGRMDCV